MSTASAPALPVAHDLGWLSLDFADADLALAHLHAKLAALRHRHPRCKLAAKHVRTLRRMLAQVAHDVERGA